MPDLKPRPREKKVEEKIEKKGKRSYSRKGDQKQSKDVEKLRETIQVK